MKQCKMAMCHGRGHMIKVADMAIIGQTFLKKNIFFSGNKGSTTPGFGM